MPLTIDEYNKAQKVSKGSENFDRFFFNMQRRGLAILLFEMKFHVKSRFGSNKLFSVKKFTPPPTDKRRLFDKNKDKYNFNF